MSDNMRDLVGWRQIECTNRDVILEAMANGPGHEPRIRVLSSLTDPAGDFGIPVIYTEWGDHNETPRLRDYRYYPDDVPEGYCRHYVPEAD